MCSKSGFSFPRRMTSIEDLYTPFQYNEKNKEAYKNVIGKLFKQYKTEEIDNKFIDRFIRIEQKNYHITLKRSVLLYVYRCICVANGAIIQGLRNVNFKKDDVCEYDKEFEFLLMSKKQRAQDGIQQCAILTSAFPEADLLNNEGLFDKLVQDENDNVIKPGQFSCEYDCDFCPKEPGMPRSYLKNEPAVLRAFQNKFDCVDQLRERLKSYIVNGHPADKLEVLVLGGTISSYSDEYIELFVTLIYFALNTLYDELPLRQPYSLEEERDLNKHSLCRKIGLTLETRPDKINDNVLRFFRRCGVTRIQVGVQHTNNRVLDRVNRKCNISKYVKAAKLMKRSGFKFDIHIMPDLPTPLLKSVSIHKRPREIDDIDWNIDMVMLDLQMFFTFIYHPDYQADQWKIYPCETVPYTTIKDEYERGVYKSYCDIKYTKEMLQKKYDYESYDIITDWNLFLENEMTESRFVNGFFSFLHECIINDKKDTYNILFYLIVYTKINVQAYVRLNRVIRDIPDMYHLGGISDTNMRQYIHSYMKKRGLVCRCIRCAAIKRRTVDDVILDVITYPASNGVENFIRIVSKDKSILIGFIRLRFDKYAGYDVDNKTIVFPELVGAAMIRELHVYGQVVHSRDKKTKHYQHVGHGTRLVKYAIEMARKNGFRKISVISGEGVKNYYEKFGFIDEDHFMTRNINRYTKNQYIMFYTFAIIILLMAILVELFYL